MSIPLSPGVQLLGDTFAPNKFDLRLDLSAGSRALAQPRMSSQCHSKQPTLSFSRQRESLLRLGSDLNPFRLFGKASLPSRSQLRKVEPRVGHWTQGILTSAWIRSKCLKLWTDS